jgi:hypothetical protein
MSHETSNPVTLEQSHFATRFPAQDLERARLFYAEKMGLEPVLIQLEPASHLLLICHELCAKFLLELLLFTPDEQVQKRKVNNGEHHRCG